jgi:hypothetical protein
MVLDWLVGEDRVVELVERRKSELEREAAMPDMLDRHRVGHAQQPGEDVTAISRRRRRGEGKGPGRGGVCEALLDGQVKGIAMARPQKFGLCDPVRKETTV